MKFSRTVDSSWSSIASAVPDVGGMFLMLRRGNEFPEVGIRTPQGYGLVTYQGSRPVVEYIAGIEYWKPTDGIQWSKP